jgi:glutaminyl-tRNA synthetase
MRRRGFTAEAIRRFCEVIGVNKRDTTVEFAQLEHCVREHLNETVPRVMGVTKPICVLIENYPEGQVEWFDAPYSPTDPNMGTRKVPFSRELYIESADFMEDAPAKFYRLTPGREVRLRYAYYVTCTNVECDADGNPTVIHCTYDPESRGGSTPDGRKVKGTIHWVSAKHAVPADVRLYEQLFTTPNPNDVPEGKTFIDLLNPESMKTVTAQCEPALAALPAGTTVQFERIAYFCVDPDTTPEKTVFNRTVTLKDSWAKMEQKA